MSEEKQKLGKPLVIKAYGSIGHLPNSRLGPADRYITFGQADILTHKKRDKFDRVIVQEKLDGSCCCVANVGGKLIALGRAGYMANSSKYPMHHAFAAWVEQNLSKFEALNLQPEERVIGEWLAYAHGTIYDLADKSPFVCFDIMKGHERILYDDFIKRIEIAALTKAPLIEAQNPITVDDGLGRLGEFGKYGAKEPCEGLVYRVERKGRVDFLSKFVKQEKIDGKYFPEKSGKEEVWNWKLEGFKKEN